MRTNTKKYVPTRFYPDVRFDVTPISDADARLRVRDRFQELQSRLVEQFLHQPENSLIRSKLDLIANDAAAIAWTTSFPLLVMPVLFQEKANEGLAREARQERIQRRSRDLFVGA